jgi:hypothetical protein
MNMQHPEIESECLIDHYVRNTMPPAQRQAFEEHFLDCPQCIDQLEIASSLRQAIRESAVEAATVSRPVESPARRDGWLGWFGWRWVQVGAFACLAVSAATSVVFFRQAQSARSELAGMQSDYARALEGATALASPPMLYVLGQSRGSVESKEITLPRDRRWMVFSVEMGTTQYPVYRATLTDGSGKQVWQQDQLQPASADAIAVTAPSNLLAPGAYTLTIETSGGSHSTLARFPLRFR